ncbi:small acid-soluble spore protein SspI [Bacillus marinisedimentorum]|uniref:small acid-soluble spore protein SspI n=1 Tax=Bacillus marinisedimentorum TaxID=1821260 RepID=UPI00087341BA|nr:small acid-soluble spore protein SspI [Bacillus marinisedimentorum]
MNFNLRQAIMANITGHDQQQLQATIQDALQSGEEKMLPGLGVLFEVLWQNTDEQDHTEMLEVMESGLKK